MTNPDGCAFAIRQIKAARTMAELRYFWENKLGHAYQAEQIVEEAKEARKAELQAKGET